MIKKMFCLHRQHAMKTKRKRHVNMCVLSFSLDVHFSHYKKSLKRVYKQK